MGTAGAVCFQRAGFDVVAWARNPEKLSQLPAAAEAMHHWLDEHQGPLDREPGRLELCSNLEEFAGRVDVIFECISEVMDRKVELFHQLGTAKQRNVLFLSATSGLPITEMARQSGLESLLVGAHFWNPPYLMPLVELIRGDETPSEVFDQACELIASVGKTVVRVEKDVPGFIGNRLQHAMWREAIRLVQDGVATAEDVDLVARLTLALRLPVLGPLENADLVGLELVRDIQSYLLKDLADDKQPIPLLTKLIEQGDLGAATGQGFYDWQNKTLEEVAERRDKQILQQLRHLGMLKSQ